MLKGNLSSRPFYNERLVSLLLGLIAVVAVVLTAFNAYTLYSLSSRRSALRTEISRDGAQAQQIARAAEALQRTVRSDTLIQLASSTQEANELIDERTFSWTMFLSYIEKTMPNDVRLVAVAPRVEKGRMKVTMGVVGKRFEDVQTFVEGLYGTGAFLDALAHSTERIEDDGTYRSDVTAYYVPPAQPPTAPKPTASPGVGRGQQ